MGLIAVRVSKIRYDIALALRGPIRQISKCTAVLSEHPDRGERIVEGCLMFELSDYRMKRVMETL